MTKLVAILVVLGMLVLPAGASAHKRAAQHPTTDPVALAVKLGEEYWGAVPCGGQITIKSEALTYDPAATSGALSQNQIASGEYEPTMRSTYTEDEGRSTECETKVNSRLWPTWLVMDHTFHFFCDTITHELGHFLGHHDADQTDPASINYARLEPGSPNYNSVPECRDSTLWYGNHRIRHT